jgi:hypothetical protein
MIATLIAEGVVLLCFSFDVVSFLWLNVIGALSALAIAVISIPFTRRMP